MPEIKDKPKGGRGGPRPNSGRKPRAITEVRDQFIAAHPDSAAYAFNLYDRLMRDETVSNTMRLDCGREIMDRVWGKPKQAVEHGGAGGGPIAIGIVEVIAPEMAGGLPDGGEDPD